MECPAWRAAPDERTVRMAEGAISGKTWCPRGFVTIEEALAQIDLGLDGRLGEDVRAAIRRLSAHREQMPDDLGDLEDAIVRELTRDGHGQLDAIAAAPVLANLLELDLNQRGCGNREVIPDDMSLSDALDYAFDVSLLMKLHGHSRELVAYLTLSSLATEYHVEVVSPAMVNLAWNALPQDRSWDDGVSVSQCLSELWERARQTNEDLLDCSPARFGRDNIFADCEIDRIWDENGHLFVSGAHHDGRVTVEVRQVSNEAERLVFDKLDYEGDIIDINPVEAMGRRYRDGDERELYHDLWEDADLCPSPRYMEREFDCPVLEYERESHDTRTTIRVYPVTPSAIAAYEEGYQFMILGQADGEYLGDLDGYPHKFCKSLGQAQERCESFVAGHWDDERPGYDLDSACREAELAADALAPERQETREIETERGDG